MRKNKSHTWEYEGHTYTVGESLSNSDRQVINQGVYPIVWYKNRLYRVAWLSLRVLIQDIYNENIYFWKNREHVFHVVKLS